jgi:hypothetical protein
MILSDRPSPNFGVGAQALALLHLLSEREPTFAASNPEGGYLLQVRTGLWYGEGIELRFRKDPDQSQFLALTIVEDPATTRLAVDHWTLDMDAFDEPCLTYDQKLKGYAESYKFPYGAFAPAIAYIETILQHFYEHHQK